jgi:HK97 family phage prohead protease
MNEDRFTRLTAKVSGADAGTITGTAVKYGVDVPRGTGLYERVKAGAFRAQIAAPNRVPVLWQHDQDSPIGRAVKLSDSHGELVFEALITEHADVPDARKALALLREGIIDEISVGFEWQTWHEERDEKTKALTIVHDKARLREFSVVTFGALGRDARVKSVASVGGLSVAAYRARLAALQA